MAERPDERSRLAAGIQMASSITTIGVEFTLPVIAGYVIDGRWHTAPLATLVGAVFGFSAGMIHILSIAKSLSATSKGAPKPPAKAAPPSDRDRDPGLSSEQGNTK